MTVTYSKRKCGSHIAKICLFGDATNIHFRRWVDGIRKHNQNLKVISIRSAIIPGVQLYDISCPELRKSVKFKKYIKIIRGIKMFFLLRRALGKIRPDIVHIHYLINTPLVFAFWDVKRLIVSPWGNDIIYDIGREPFFNILYKKKLLREATEITATTKFLAKCVRKYTKRRPLVIPFGVDTAQFNGVRKSKHGIITISFIKHLEEKYGPRHLINAVPLILEKVSNIKVCIAGSGSQGSMLQGMVKTLGIKSYVEFIGRINHEQVIECLRNTDIFVMPSVYASEVFGVSAVEASAMRIPVIASNLEGIREAVIDGVTGILIPPGDVYAIADACLHLIDDVKLRKEMGIRGRQFVQKNLEWNDCVTRMIKVYDRALSS